MTTVVEILAVIFTIWVVTVLAALWWLARRNRVAPDARTGAPLHWLAAPSRAAGAHRRLRRAVAAARAGLAGIAVDGPAHAELAACVSALERQAVDLDHRLVVAAHCPPATRWKLVGELEPQIRDVERIGGRLAAIAVLAPTTVAPTGEGFEALDERLAALAAARAELDAIDADAPATPGSTGGVAEHPAAVGELPSADRILPAGGGPGLGVSSPTPAAQPAPRSKR